MSGTSTAPAAIDLARRFGAFLTERFPFALNTAFAAFEAAGGPAVGVSPEALEQFPEAYLPELRRRLIPQDLALSGFDAATPGVSSSSRFAAAVEEIASACDAFFRRAAIRASLTPDERREILRGMVLTRATDNRLKAFFTGGEVRYGGAAFQGKGFRSLGQEAIYAAGIRLRRGDRYRQDGEWRGDVDCARDS